MKKSLFLILLSLGITMAQAQDFTVDDIQYSFNTEKTSEVNVWGYVGESGDMTVPETVTYNNVTYRVTGVLGDKEAENWWEDPIASGLHGNMKIKNVVLPNSVRTIGNSAFYGSTVETIQMPNTLDNMGNEVFCWCTQLTDVVMPRHIGSMGSDIFTHCILLEEITLPEGLPWSQYSMQRMFYDSGITTIHLPKDMTAVPTGFFGKCHSLKQIVLPEAVREIGMEAFSGCIALESCPLPAKVNSIGNMAFQDCIMLTTFAASDSLRSIGNWAFQRCYGLQSVSLSDSTSIIDTQAFNECIALKSFEVGSKNPLFSTNDGVLYDKAGKALVLFPYGKGTVFSIPQGTTALRGGAFGQAPLTAITMPASLETIEESALNSCKTLEQIHFAGTTPPAMPTSAFSQTSDACQMYCPSGSIDAYKTAEALSRFTITEENGVPFIYESIMPVAGTYTDAIDTLTITFPERAIIQATNPEVSLTLADGTAVEMDGEKWTAMVSPDNDRVVNIMRIDADGNTISIALTNSTNYIINIPAGIVTNEAGLGNGNITLPVNGKELVMPVSSTPADGSVLPQIEDMTLTFGTDVKTVNSMPTLSLTCENGSVDLTEYIENSILSVDYVDKTMVTLMLFDKNYAPGIIPLVSGLHYEFTIPAGCIANSNGNTNDDIMLHFTGGDPTSISIANTAGRNITSKMYYNIEGKQQTMPFDGLNIIKIGYSDGTSVTIKMNISK